MKRLLLITLAFFLLTETPTPAAPAPLPRRGRTAISQQSEAHWRGIWVHSRWKEWLLYFYPDRSYQALNAIDGRVFVGKWRLEPGMIVVTEWPLDSPASTATYEMNFDGFRRK